MDGSKKGMEAKMNGMDANTEANMESKMDGLEGKLKENIIRGLY